MTATWILERTASPRFPFRLTIEQGEVVRLVLGRGLRIVAAGTGLGLVAAYAGARAIERQLPRSSGGHRGSSPGRLEGPGTHP